MSIKAWAIDTLALELKSLGAAIPNPAVLINSIPLLEARASSEIENIVTTSAALFRYSHDDDDADPATKKVLLYRSALREGFDSLADQPLSTNTAVRVCSRLKIAKCRFAEYLERR